jgi:hypothetical protein
MAFIMFILLWGGIGIATMGFNYFIRNTMALQKPSATMNVLLIVGGPISFIAIWSWLVYHSLKVN